MTARTFTETVPLLPGAVESAALGATATRTFTELDKCKFVKLAANDNYVLAVDGDDIEAMTSSVEAGTVNDGYSFGGVQIRFLNLVVRHKAAESAIAVGAYVVVGTQAALGTTQTHPIVKAGAGVAFKWRVKSLMGNAGAAGALLLIEPVTR